MYFSINFNTNSELQFQCNFRVTNFTSKVTSVKHSTCMYMYVCSLCLTYCTVYTVKNVVYLYLLIHMYVQGPEVSLDDYSALFTATKKWVESKRKEVTKRNFPNSVAEMKVRSQQDK